MISQAEQARLYGEQMTLDALERQQALAADRWPCCWEPRLGQHHPLCGKQPVEERRLSCCGELCSLGHLPDCPERRGDEAEPSANPFSGMTDQFGEVIP